MAGQEKYSKYSFEDFLQDDFFVASVKRPTEEGIAFWNRFLKDYPEQTDVFRAAGKFVEEVTASRISDEEVAGIWMEIQGKQRKLGKQWNSGKPGKLGKVRKMAYTAVAVAASIALLLVARVFFIGLNDHPTGSDIMAFVGIQADSLNISGDVQLILSEQKSVFIQGKESVITYDSTSIHAGPEKIAKNEIASYNQLMVPYGKNSVLTLHDGTKIWVNAGTRLVYPVEFEKDKREIYVNGEIFLDVASDEHRPFVVRTNDFSIQVVGTRFNVQAYASDAQSRIALEEGVVKIVSGTAGDVVLNPNEMFEQDKSGHSSVKDADIGKYTSWIHGLYMYESEQLDVILKRLERYYGREIVVGPSVSEIRCSGKLDLKENMEDVLSVISKTAPIKYVADGESYIVSYQP